MGRGCTAFERWCAGRDLCVDVLPDFAAAWDAGEDTRNGGHWNALGHRLVAERLAAELP